MVLELGYRALVAVVALQLVEHLHEHLEDRRLVGAADAIELQIDVEQQAAGWYRRGLPEVGVENLVLQLRQQDISIGRRPCCPFSVTPMRRSPSSSSDNSFNRCDLPDPKQPEILTSLAWKPAMSERRSTGSRLLSLAARSSHVSSRAVT
ncbi:MAG: hypothetical protein WAM11_08260 [Cyanobium sp.]